MAVIFDFDHVSTEDMVKLDGHLVAIKEILGECPVSEDFEREFDAELAARTEEQEQSNDKYLVALKVYDEFQENSNSSFVEYCKGNLK